jgi:hypothetical protein
LLVRFYNSINKISNLKHQIPNKSQISIFNTRRTRRASAGAAGAPALRVTKTFAKIAARHDVKSGEPGMMPADTMADGSFVWIFEFGLLGFVWDLVFGAWNFHNSC